ncbi:unnamed protein product [Ectocarpus sp. 12 AP-2014]
MRSAVAFLPLCLVTASGFMMRTCPGRSCRMADQSQHDGVEHAQPAPSSSPLSRQAFLGGAAAAIPLVVGVGRAVADNEIIEKMVADKIAAGWQEPEVTQRAFMDITIGGSPSGRLVINLYGKVVPDTVKNFVALITGKNAAGVSYQGTEAYRVLDGLNIQMGAIGSRSGKSGVSSTGENIPQENFDIKHMKEGLLSMVRNADAQGDSRFFISIKDDAGWADNRYVAFGRIAEGMDVVHLIERVKVEGGTNKPKKPVVIEKCGML